MMKKKDFRQWTIDYKLKKDLRPLTMDYKGIEGLV